MKMERTLLIWIAGILALSAPYEIKGQSGQQDPNLLNSAVYRESYRLFTDRDIYAVNERILFRAFNTSAPELKKSDWSKVLYVELLNGSNTPVRQAKYLLSEEGTWGYLDIPDSLTTGSYCLRAYTKWMRNFDPGGFFHAVLTIVNPRKQGSSWSTDAGSSTVFSGPAQRSSDVIDCRTDRKSYGKREKVTVSLSADGTGIDSGDGYCLTVVKKDFLDTEGVTDLSGIAGAPRFDSVRYLPETRGLSVTGEILTSRHEPAAYRETYLTLLGSMPDCLGSTSDYSGRINISVPQHYGSQDVLIVVDESDPVEVVLDNEFSKDFIPASELPYRDPSGRISSMEEIMIHMQVKEAFGSGMKDTLESVQDRLPGTNFYGKPARRIRPDFYIDLPTLEEFFFELIHEVTIRRSKKVRSFVIYPLTFLKPLVLLDYVPVFDIETIMPVSPQRIEYIDIIDDMYLRGDSYYGGIINIVSRESDRGGVDLPGNSFFFTYRSFETQDEIVFPDYNEKQGTGRIADVRNTLYWLPDVDINDETGRQFDFFTSDIPGEYMIIVRGINGNGEIVQGQCDFVVE